MADAFMERFRRGNSYRRYQVRQTIAAALANQTDPDELWSAMLRLGELSKPVSTGSLQFAFSEIRNPPDNVRRLHAGRSTADERVAQGQALAAMFREQEQRALESGRNPPQESA
jgi:hypothetical protein